MYGVNLEKTMSLWFRTGEEVTESGRLLPLGTNSLLSKIGDQRCDRKCYLRSVGYLVNAIRCYVESPR